MFEFHPHPLLQNGHLQTLGGVCRRLPKEQATRQVVDLPDGDQVIIHDDRPPQWQPGQRIALLVHGLCGSHRSGYMVRVAQQLRQLGIRTCRLDMRGCGAGLALAHYPYHSGRSEDIRQALIEIQQQSPTSPLSLIAFSLCANTALKMLGEDPTHLPTQLDQAIAVSPPIDLALCVESLQRYPARIYDLFFSHTLVQQVHANPRLSERAASIFAHHRPTRLIEFDDMFTAPLSGFGTASNYYARCSAKQFLSAINIPTTILIAKDDPIVPWQPIVRGALSSAIQVIAPEHGGHLGFIAAGKNRRWMDETIGNLVSALQ